MTIGLSILLSLSSMGFLSLINSALENPPSVAPGSGDATLLAPPEFQGPLKLELQGLKLQLRNSKIIRSLSSCRSKDVKNPGVVVQAIKKSRLYHDLLCHLLLLDWGKFIVTNPGEKRCLSHVGKIKMAHLEMFHDFSPCVQFHDELESLPIPILPVVQMRVNFMICSTIRYKCHRNVSSILRKANPRTH